MYLMFRLLIIIVRVRGLEGSDTWMLLVVSHLVLASSNIDIYFSKYEGFIYLRNPTQIGTQISIYLFIYNHHISEEIQFSPSNMKDASLMWLKTSYEGFNSQKFWEPSSDRKPGDDVPKKEHRKQKWYNQKIHQILGFTHQIVIKMIQRGLCF